MEASLSVIFFNLSSARYYSGKMSSLPIEILRYIISFFPNHEYRGIFKFRTICKEWKDIVERSSLWIERSLPPPISSSSRPHQTPPSNLIIDTPTKFKTCFTMNYSRQETVLLLTEKADYFAISWPRVTFIYQEENNLDQQNHQELAYRISTNFIKRFCEFHEAWDRYLKFYRFIQVFQKIDNRWIEPFFLHGSLINLIILIIATGLVSTIGNSATSLTWSEHLGFACIYFNGLFYLSCVLLRMMSQMSSFASANHANLVRPYEVIVDTRHANHAVISFYILGFIGSIALLQSKLSSQSSSFRYIYIPVPIWCSTALSTALLSSINCRWKVGIVSCVFLCFFFCITTLLVALYYDYNSHVGITSLGFTFLPLIPIELLLLCLAIYDIQNTIFLWYKVFLGERIVSMFANSFCCIPAFFIRIMINLLGTFAVIFMFLLLMNLNYEAFIGSLDFATGFVSLLLFLVCIQIASICIKLDGRDLLIQ